MKRPPLQSEAMREKWKKRIMLEKSYSEKTAKWMAQRLDDLLDHIQYGHAIIAYHKQNGEFRFVKATLINYVTEFHREYDVTRVEGAVVYWDVEQQGWRTFRVENFLEWRPTV